MLIAVKSKRFSVTGYKQMFVILIKKTLGSGFKYSAFDYCEIGVSGILALNTGLHILKVTEVSFLGLEFPQCDAFLHVARLFSKKTLRYCNSPGDGIM